MGTFNSPLWNESLWNGDDGSQADDPPEPVFLTATVLGRLYPRLHAEGASDLVYWTDSELAEWMNRAGQRLARAAGVWVTRATTDTAAATRTYDLPVDHVSTIHCSNAGIPIRPATNAELAARDASYETTSGTPQRWFQDTIGLAFLGLWPVPGITAELAIIYHRWVDATVSVPAPEIVACYLGDAALAEAYAKDSESRAPEIAAHLAPKLRMYEQLFRAYWGAGQ